MQEYCILLFLGFASNDKTYDNENKKIKQHAKKAPKLLETQL